MTLFRRSALILVLGSATLSATAPGERSAPATALQRSSQTSDSAPATPRFAELALEPPAIRTSLALPPVRTRAACSVTMPVEPRARSPPVVLPPDRRKL